MSLMSWLTRSSPPPGSYHTEKRDEHEQLRAELAREVTYFEQRAHTVTQIAQDAIRSMNKGDKK